MFLVQTLNTFYWDLQANYLNESHTFEIRVLTQPMFCEYFGELVRALDFNHMGIAFIDEQTGKPITLQYGRDPFNYTHHFIDILRPRAVWNATKNLWDFIWDLKDRVMVEDEIKLGECLWESQTVVATHVSGLNLNNFFHKFSQKFHDEAKFYQMLELRYADTKERFNGMKSKSCQDYVWRGLQNLEKDYGVVFNGKSIKRLQGWFNLDRTHPDPKPMNLDDPADNAVVYHFYKYLQMEAMKYHSQSELVRDYLSGKLYQKMKIRWPTLHFIMIIDNKYWSVTTSEFLIGMQTPETVVPGTEE